MRSRESEGQRLASDKPTPARDKSKLPARWSTQPLAGHAFPSRGDGVYVWGGSFDSINIQSLGNNMAEDGGGRNQLTQKVCSLGQETTKLI